MKVFVDRYRAETYDRTRKEVQEADSAIIKGFQDRIAELEKQVEHSRIVISRRSSDRAEDGIILTFYKVEGEHDFL